jgi:agmatine/peptidylarginine deiminase
MMVKTDFNQIKELYLVYPEGVGEMSKSAEESYSHLAKFYDNLIHLIPEKITIKLFTKSEKTAQRIKALGNNIDVMVNSQISSIWIRDWSGFSNGKILFKPSFRPQYYYGGYKLADRINQTAYSLHSFMGLDLKELPIVLDGGNFVSNGDIAIITNRILKDNKNLSKSSIESIIKDNLGVDPIFVDEMEDEATGHADGVFAFASKKDLIISQYPESWREKDREYLDNQARKFKNMGFEIHRILDFPEILNMSAIGLFVNFLRLNDRIIMPTYSSVADRDIEHNKKLLSQFGEVTTIDCTDLASHGGVLHCISFTN